MPDRIPADWPEVRLITTSDELSLAIQDWAGAGVLGIDTESNSFFAYTERLCLLQVSTSDRDYIVDPLALGDDLRSINELLADPSLVKVLHSAEFDLMLLKKDLDADVRGLFDTQVAMTLLGHQQTGLAALLKATYGLELSKKEQRSNWGRRPLTEPQLAYARIDTHFLPDLHARLASELADSGMAAAAHGEFDRLEHEVLEPRPFNPEGWSRLKGARNLSPPAAARLKRLYVWREQQAEQADVPVFRILGNEVLIRLSEEQPDSVQKLGRMPGFGWRNAKRIGADILAELAAAAAEPIEKSARKRRPASKAEVARRQVVKANKETLRRWRKSKADRLGLPPERLMHRRHLEEVARKLPRTAAELARTIRLNDWQREHLEASLLEVLASLPNPASKAPDQPRPEK